jgi:hypothetical protein
MSGSVSRLQLDTTSNYPNLVFPADHSADKIRLYNGGSEKIGTSAHTLILTATSHSFKDTDGHENFKIGPTGDVELLATGKLYLDGGSHTYITELADDNLSVVVGGQEVLDLNDGNTGNFLRTASGYIQFGPLNTGGAHIYTDREQFFFNKKLTLGVTAGNSIIRGYNPAAGDDGDIGFDRASNNTGRRQFLVKSGSTDHLFNGAVEFRLSQSGDFHADGDVIAASAQISSDRRLKENIEDLPYGLNEVIKLRPVEFNWIKEKRDGKHDIGVIAQEVEDIIPEIVKETLHLPMEKNYKSVDYAKLAVVLVNAVKEQQEQIDELKEDIKKLKE